jgi:hypothetical protein
MDETYFDKEAARLTNLTGETVCVQSETGTYGISPDDACHLYDVFLSDPNDEHMTLDDRMPEPLTDQLTSELRRISQLYTDLADQVERRSAELAIA